MYQKSQISAALEAAQRPRFAAIARRYWDHSLAEYSHDLYMHTSPPILEAELLEAFTGECQRMGQSRQEIEEITASLKALGVLQTTTHVALTEGPTFLAAHQLATLGYPANAYYIVAAFSGIPFSNSAWPACLNYSKQHAVEDLIDPACPGFADFIRAEKNRGLDTPDRRLSLLPGKYRDARVYRSQLNDKIRQIQPYINPALGQLLAPTEREDSFSRWALQAAENQLHKIISHKQLVYIDLNEMICNYLRKVIGKKGHPIHRLFFDTPCQQDVLQVFGEQTPIFNLNVKRKNKWKQQNAYLKDQTLISPQGIIKFDQESLLAGLADGQFCPSLFLCFIILSFLNGLQCLGGFNQIEYLYGYGEKLKKINWLDPALLDKTRLDGLSTGLSTDHNGERIFPLDIILGRRWEVDKDQTMGHWFQPLIAKLLKHS